MNIPRNIRVNTTFPFPALVQGSGPVTVLTKMNGIWTVGFSMSILAAQVPPPANYATDYLIVWDAQTNTFFRMSIADLIASLGIATGAARLQRLVVTTPIVVSGSDAIINCNVPVAAACTLPPAAARGGVPLTFKDMGQASLHPITLTASGGDGIDGQASIRLANNWQAITLVPFHDGTSTGWAVE